jgi:hypothetical protein
MWHETPEQRLQYVKERQTELVSQAAADRAVARRAKAADHGFTGLHLRVGTLLIVIGRTLCEDEVLAPTYR